MILNLIGFVALAIALTSIVAVGVVNLMVTSALTKKKKPNE